MRINLIEDDHTFATALTKALSIEGNTVDSVNTSEAALFLVENTDADAVILDLGLPDKDGLEVLATLKRITFGIIGYPGFATYSANKFAMSGFSQALAREHGDTDIRIRYFAPGATKTGLNSAAVNTLNAELGVTMDSTKTVARAFSQFLRSNALICQIGWPERFVTWLNKLSPGTVGSALIKHLPVIRRHVSSA